MLDAFVIWIYKVLRWQKCDECNRPAGWLRRTQFAAEQYFCDNHARQQENFHTENPSYYVWERVA